MKKILSVILSAVMLCGVAVPLSAAEPADFRTPVYYMDPADFTLDGDLSEWEGPDFTVDSQKQPVSKAGTDRIYTRNWQEGGSHDAPLPVKFYWRYDENHLYLGVKVNTVRHSDKTKIQFYYAKNATHPSMDLKDGADTEGTPIEFTFENGVLTPSIKKCAVKHTADGSIHSYEIRISKAALKVDIAAGESFFGRLVYADYGSKQSIMTASVPMFVSGADGVGETVHQYVLMPKDAHRTPTPDVNPSVIDENAVPMQYLADFTPDGKITEWGEADLTVTEELQPISKTGADRTYTRNWQEGGSHDAPLPAEFFWRYDENYVYLALRVNTNRHKDDKTAVHFYCSADSAADASLELLDGAGKEGTPLVFAFEDGEITAPSAQCDVWHTAEGKVHSYEIRIEKALLGVETVPGAAFYGRIVYVDYGASQSIMTASVPMFKAGADGVGGYVQQFVFADKED